MKFWSIPSAIYFLLVGTLLIISENPGQAPFSDCFAFFPNTAVQGIASCLLGIVILIGLKSGIMILGVLMLMDIAVVTWYIPKLEMQNLSEALQKIAYKLIVLGIVIANLGDEIMPQKHKVGVKPKSKQNTGYTKMKNEKEYNDGEYVNKNKQE